MSNVTVYDNILNIGRMTSAQAFLCIYLPGWKASCSWTAYLLDYHDTQHLYYESKGFLLSISGETAE